jgi:uncharacterized membrane protein (UPF0182 family)
MAEEKSLIVKLAVPVMILLSLALCGTCTYFGWFNTIPSNGTYGITMLFQLVAYMSFGIVFFLTLGTLAKYYKFRQDELDRWSEEAMSGKPPI